MTKLLLLFITLSLPIQLFAANYPFPHDADYQYGIRAKNGSDKLQNAYQDWYDDFYEEKGDKAYIPDGSQAFSEGIGYGMLIMVYMDNDENNTQDKFNKLWTAYESHLDKHGLMNWKIGWETGEVWGEYAATDAEVDVALALLMAYKQWGDDKYLTDAKDLISKIWDEEVNANKYLKPGDNWDDKKNPSYFSTAAMQLFKEVDNNDWQTVIDNSYSLIKKSQNLSTGLIPDWCSETGDDLGTSYYYDAARTPWRMATAYSWFGHQDAYDINEKITKWVDNKTGGNPSKIAQGYSLTGSALNNYPANTVFTGALACGGMVDDKFQDWVNKGLSSSIDVEDDGYFKKTTQILYLIQLTGNMPNMWSDGTSVKNYDKALFNRKIIIAPMPVSTNSRILFSNIESGEYSVEVVSISGREIINEKISINRNSGEIIINSINSITDGIYYLLLKRKNKIVSVERFVKIK